MAGQAIGKNLLGIFKDSQKVFFFGEICYITLCFRGGHLTKITRIKIPQFASNELNPKVLKLLEIIQQQGEAIQQLRDEVAQLKGHKIKPKIKPSKMDE